MLLQYQKERFSMLKRICKRCIKAHIQDELEKHYHYLDQKKLIQTHENWFEHWWKKNQRGARAKTKIKCHRATDSNGNIHSTTLYMGVTEFRKVCKQDFFLGYNFTDTNKPPDNCPYLLEHTLAVKDAKIK
jgi:hypothetical protein